MSNSVEPSKNLVTGRAASLSRKARNFRRKHGLQYLNLSAVVLAEAVLHPRTQGIDPEGVHQAVEPFLRPPDPHESPTELHFARRRSRGLTGSALELQDGGLEVAALGVSTAEVEQQLLLFGVVSTALCKARVCGEMRRRWSMGSCRCRSRGGGGRTVTAVDPCPCSGSGWGGKVDKSPHRAHPLHLQHELAGTPCIYPLLCRVPSPYFSTPPNPIFFHVQLHAEVTYCLYKRATVASSRSQQRGVDTVLC